MAKTWVHFHEKKVTAAAAAAVVVITRPFSDFEVVYYRPTVSCYRCNNRKFHSQNDFSFFLSLSVVGSWLMAGSKPIIPSPSFPLLRPFCLCSIAYTHTRLSMSSSNERKKNRPRLHKRKGIKRRQSNSFLLLLVTCIFLQSLMPTSSSSPLSFFLVLMKIHQGRSNFELQAR